MHWCQDAYHALEGADAAVILTEWNEFRGLDLERAREVMRAPLLIDLRNIFNPAQVAAAGFDYISIGRPACRRPPEIACAPRIGHARPGHSFHPTLLREYDIRGIVGIHAASRPTRAPSARASAPWCGSRRQEGRRGHDGRLSSPEFAAARRRAGSRPGSRCC